MKSFVIGMVTAAALVAGASAQQTPTKPDPAKPDQTKEQPKPDPKPAADVKDVAGKWNVALETQNGVMNSALDIKLDGKKVTGTIASPQGETAITGEFADGKLTFSISFDAGNGPMQLTFSADLKADGSLAGSMSMGDMGQLPFTATRVKDKQGA